MFSEASSSSAFSFHMLCGFQIGGGRCSVKNNCFVKIMKKWYSGYFTLAFRLVHTNIQTSSDSVQTSSDVQTSSESVRTGHTSIQDVPHW
jgi:hypothetical protein